MILGRGILSKIPIDICFYYNKMMLNGGAYAGCTTPMKYVEKSTSMHHLNGFRTNLFGMNIYGIANRCCTLQGICGAY